MQHDERFDVAAFAKGSVHPLPGLSDAVVDVVAAAAPLPVGTGVGVQSRLQLEALLFFALAFAFALLAGGGRRRSQGGSVLCTQGATHST